jgi:hypothetical protein
MEGAENRPSFTFYNDFGGEAFCKCRGGLRVCSIFARGCCRGRCGEACAIRALAPGRRQRNRGKEIDRSWAETIKVLLRDQPVDREFIARVLEKDEATLALLFYHLHFYLIRRSGRWIHDGSR